MYLEKINCPIDLKKMSMDALPILATEIREVLINKASVFGGHLSSNLGIVDATIAIHYVFDSPKDKIVFDVSHQCYTHKILTGRKDGFIEPDKYSKINGYTNPEESIHDYFRVGHTATSISLACGMAKARDLRGDNENIIVIIGDGSLSGGEALEGLDYAGSDIKGNLIIIFNDNQMSIAENHGGIYNNLQLLRETEGQAENNIFRAFGCDYRFVKDGNDVASVIKVLQEVKDIEHPIVIHICTTKGKGYSYAEKNKEQTHWVRPFSLQNGEEKNPFNGERYDRIIRDYLIDKMKADSAVVTMIAAVPDALSFSEEYRKKAGEQFVDVGIAEEHAISMAAGIARNGGKPVFATMSTFYQRTYDQISQELCINMAPATLIVVNASVYAANDVTHIGIFDIPMMSNIPNLVYLAPTNKQEYLAMLDWSIEQNEYPVAIRAPRNGVFYAKGEVDSDYSELNKYKVTQEGSNIAIIALGDFYQMGENLADEIVFKYGFNPTLINPRYITGIDDKLLEQLKNEHYIVITLEDGVLEGGFGQKIASFYGTSTVKVINYGLKKEFLDRYNVEKTMEKNRLRIDLIINDLDELVNSNIIV
ncbi:MAG: 1-deoxy-D-xylulose-5-phosphate synthase [Lachnospiraceae bacterium]|nr:1-deoxy-D-xylulose-5-phosphate synthase [Lachnospiraceae bacterium]